MTGQEMRALRRSAGLSQIALAAAIGLSRESVGRMERGHDAVEKRTELALRYIATMGVPSERPLAKVHNDVARLLDDAAVRAAPSVQRAEALKDALVNWTAAGGCEAGRQLIYRAQGVLGLINVTKPTDAAWLPVVSDLAKLKLEWAETAR